jgi:3-hydroxyisobutyrate dehydrogenase-like beta-hydroxyacid dehydrogenase
VAFRLVLERKDLLLALDVAESLGLDLAQARVNLTVVDAAIAAGYGDHDMSAVADYLRHGDEEPG